MFIFSKKNIVSCAMDSYVLLYPGFLQSFFQRSPVYFSVAEEIFMFYVAGEDQDPKGNIRIAGLYVK